MKRIFLISFSANCSMYQNINGEKTEFKGRIAWSTDGNFNDEDDWAASPVALAIFC
jgi:hypothetical protein